MRKKLFLSVLVKDCTWLDGHQPLYPQQKKDSHKAASIMSVKEPNPRSIPPSSRKNRQKPRLNTKRHCLVTTTPTGIGAEVASRPNRRLGQGKRAIWMGQMGDDNDETVHTIPRMKRPKYIHSLNHHQDDIENQPEMEHESTAAATTETATTTTTIYSASSKCLIESQSATELWKLRKQFVIQCRPIVPPVLTLERWYQTIFMTREDQNLICPQATMNAAAAAAAAAANDGIVQDLQRVGMESQQIHSILRWLEKQQQQRQHQFRTTTSMDPNHKSTDSSNNLTLHVIRHKHTLDLILYPKKAQMWKLNYEHYEKLQALWMRTWKNKNTNVSCDIDKNNNQNQESDNAMELSTQFHQDLFCLLCRYNSLQGPGFQAACPEQVFVVLRSQFQVSHECFASPLNCFFDSYCSAFMDVDEAFGSSGSFWDFQPTTGGSFHANPPFVHAIMVRMVAKLESLLSQDIPLSFVIIVPVWLEDSSYHALLTSPYQQYHMILAKADHGFCDGSQHQRRDRYRTSPYDTAVILWQNLRGTQVYGSMGKTTNGQPVWETSLRQAFATGVPTAAAQQRRIRDGRGLADEDGGGGQYRGRKRNRTGDGVQQRKQRERRAMRKPKGRKKNI
jgi:hypothetical protein